MTQLSASRIVIFVFVTFVQNHGKDIPEDMQYFAITYVVVQKLKIYIKTDYNSLFDIFHYKMIFHYLHFQ
jgi:hypothetical protein